MSIILPKSSSQAAAFLLLAAGLAAQPAAAQWTTQNSGLPANGGIRSISIVDANTVWASGYDGASANSNSNTYTRTTNGGTTWTTGTIPETSAAFINISAASSTTAWATFDNLSAGGGRLYYTADGGTTWTQQLTNGFPASSGGFVDGVLAFSATQAVVAGDPVSTTGNFEIYYTTDAGTTWTAATTPARIDANEGGLTSTVITVPGATAAARSCWMATGSGRVLRSTDSGVTWAAATTGLAQVSRLAFCNATTGLAVNSATPTQVAYTTDGGATWALRTITSGKLYTSGLAGVPGLPNAFVSTGNNANGLGSSYTLDGGATWTTGDSGTSHTAVSFLNSTTGWSGGFATSPTVGGIYKGTLPATALATTSAALPATSIGVYPNPATDAFAVTVPAVVGTAQVQVTLLNSLGQSVAYQASSLGAAGSQLRFSTARLAAGLYTLRVQAGSAVASKQVSVQ